MNGERWERLNVLFHEALQREPAQRNAFLQDECGSDEALQREVRSLLRSHEQAEGFLTGPASARVEATPEASRSGGRLGRYELLDQLGAGGMGEVYRARDDSLGREVALKVLPLAVAADPDRLRRFQQEARAAGQLNHPHVLVVYDAGEQDGVPYIVSELLEGATLRERLRDGPLPASKAAQLAAQVARGLGAAHARGIVHRDLKPENLFVTREGHAKILDFGLAKALHTEAAPAEAATAPGFLLGTLGYMSPEQARGAPVDHRCDIFALGAVLFEMLTGRRAFGGGTPTEILAAILRDDPTRQLDGMAAVSPALARTVRHCLEKLPDERFQSARDLAFELEAATATAVEPQPAPRRSIRPALRRMVAAVAAMAAVAGAYLAGARGASGPVPSFRQLTYRRGTVHSARFSPDGHGVYYAAAWEGRPAAAFAMRLDGHEARDLGFGARRIVSILPGEMAFLHGEGAAGTLARLPLEGGAPRDEQVAVEDADWSRDGRRLALIRRSGDRTRLEFPSGRVLHETAGRLVTPRVSPDGRAVAVVDQSMLGNTPGALVLVHQDGRVRRLSEGWGDIGGVAWHPGGGEVWFSATRTGSARALHAVSTSGRYRLVARTPGAMKLEDISPGGDVLFTSGTPRTEAYGRLRGDTAERDLSWFDWTHASDLLPDGRGVLFTAEGEGGGPLYSLYLRRDPDAAPVRLAEGHGTELSPDGTVALAMIRSSPPRLMLLPAGPGEPATLAPERVFAEHHWAWWFPDGRRVLLLANEAGRPVQLFVLDRAGGAPRTLAPPGVTAYRHKPITPDGRHVLVLIPGSTPGFGLWPVDGGSATPVPGLEADDQPLRWSSDGRHLFVRTPGPAARLHVERLDVATGRREPWLDWRPADPAGVVHIADVMLSADGRSHVLNCQRTISELYLAQGLR